MNGCTHNDMQLQLYSQPESISQIETFVEKVRRQFKIPDELYSDILLVLTEAVTNSIRHGNGLNPQKVVQVSCNCKSGNLFFTVTDEGCGFKPETVADPTAADRISLPNGRGVFLMKQLSDYVCYADNGRKVEICFKR